MSRATIQRYRLLQLYVADVVKVRNAVVALARLVACEMAKSLRLVVFLVMYRVALLQAEVVVLFAVECVRDTLFATFFFC